MPDVATADAPREAIFRRELAAAVADRSGADVDVVQDVINGMTAEITERLTRGETVVLRGFGTFEGRSMRAVTRVHPESGQFIQVPAKVKPIFRPSRQMKRQVAGEAE